MDLFDIAIAKKLVGGSGGGGVSSDFSTAEVTITTEGEDQILFPVLKNDCITLHEDFISTGDTINVVLYKGKCALPYEAFQNNIFDYVSVSGNATKDEDNSTIIITGDCTIQVTTQ